ncbi:Kinase superfamily protein isoform 2 [Hibiscus syriacus]|uniref:Kinase superfamily protein isoform 2 n=1 Tax=Hibiscus syriacus TaxID=106335 RepID=A0A6A3C2U2_HIBSY|nr:Kinase superfamily protein isoform 2 [Hibiscus syriacus]
METFSYYPETSLQDYSTLKYHAKNSDRESAVYLETKETAGTSAGSAKIPQFQGSDPRTLSSTESAILREYNAGLFLESFSIELLVLAIWKKALLICGSWITSAPDNESHGSSSANQPTINVWGNADSGPNPDYTVGLNTPSSACIWAEQGFIVACDRTEKLQCHLQDMDATGEMPDAMEIIYQTALTIGRNGEAESVPLNPPFSLTPANKKRIQTYIKNLQTRQSQFLTSAPFPKLSADFHTK